MMRSIDDILADASPREDSISLCLRGDLVSRYEKLKRQLSTASTESESLGEPSEAYVIASQMKDLHDEMAASETQFMLRALPSDEFSDLNALQPAVPIRKAGVPADPAAMKKYREDFTVWYREIIAATCYDPIMTPDQVAKLAKKLSSGQWREFSDRVWELNTGDDLVPFSEAASEILQATEPK